MVTGRLEGENDVFLEGSLMLFRLGKTFQVQYLLYNIELDRVEKLGQRNIHFNFKP